MNKQEAIKKVNSLQFTETFLSEIVWVKRDDVINIINQIDEPQKVVIPKIVAEWIETARRNEDLGFMGLFDFSESTYDELSYKVLNWAEEDKNSEKLARAWLGGYEIEEEKLYTVEIPNNDGTLVLTSINGRLKLDHGYKCFPAKLTEEKIREKFNWAWQWAKPVEEE
ncbi:DUF1642 domain-containing protein [Streptococcus hillyeri]|uniref:DUF1642 domain-containing protein n=1 Tax=Streptococcus hillyeri TaxID=2282420 RepID=UPI0034E19B8D